MDDEQRVFPHVLRKDIGDELEQVAVANVDGISVLVVPVSEECAHGVISAMASEGMEVRPTTVEEIEAVCADYGLATVGLFGLDDGAGLDVISVEVVGLVLEEGA